MYPGTDNDILRVTFSSPCRGVLNTPHKRPGTGRIRAKPHESRIHPKMDDANTRRSFSAENVCRAYAIRPYTGTKTVRAGWRRSFSAENVCGAYAIRPYTDAKTVRAGLRRSFSAENDCRAYAIRPYTGMKMVRAGWRRS